MLLVLLLACDGEDIDSPMDADGDGYSITDCDDSSADAHPGATEVCDGLDNDCNGEVDEQGGLTLHVDADGDGYADPSISATLCQPGEGWVDNFQVMAVMPLLSPNDRLERRAMMIRATRIACRKFEKLKKKQS